jgi:hypothetical protein
VADDLENMTMRKVAPDGVSEDMIMPTVDWRNGVNISDIDVPT